MNLPIKGWNECLITYILAAASSLLLLFPKQYIQEDGRPMAPMGLPTAILIMALHCRSGQLMEAPCSFPIILLGVNPNGLTDAYAAYQTQVVNHSRINYEYCKANPKSYFGYSDFCWGLTASDISGGYAASSPANDLGFIAPTAALSSFPYTPVESMKALKFFYYVLGDKTLEGIWFCRCLLAKRSLVCRFLPRY